MLPGEFGGPNHQVFVKPPSMNSGGFGEQKDPDVWETPPPRLNKK